MIPDPCRCVVCVTPSPRRTAAEATARYRRLRQLEAEIVMRRARDTGRWLEATIGVRAHRFAPHALRAAMAAGACHWHRSFWRLIDPPVGTGDAWRRVRRTHGV